MLHASDNYWVVLISLIIVLNVVIAQQGRVPNIRRIPGLNAIDEAIGRATEMGRPALMIPGITGLGVGTLAGLSILGNIAQSIARFGNKVILLSCDPIVTGVAEETIRDAYTNAGRQDLYHDEDVRYLTSEQFAFAAGAAGIMNREKPAASFLFGDFFAESLIFAETGQQIGAIQIAGTPQTEQIPFFLAACDYVIIGEEYYAASAYITRNPTYLGSIVGQDFAKLILISIVLLGVIGASIVQFGHYHAGFGHISVELQKLLDLLKA